MTDSKALIERLRADWPEILVEKHWMMDSDAIEEQRREAADYIEKLEADNARLREANGILEDGLQEVGDDYPGSSCQEWCQHQIKQARAALQETSHDRD